MAEALSFHCIVCYDLFDSEINYSVVLACGHTYVCVNCAKRLIKCMECRISLLYPLECDPAYIAAVAAAEKEEKIKAAQKRKPRDRSVIQTNSLQPIRIKPEDRMRLPAPKNLVLSSLIEATIGTLATTNSSDLGDGEFNNIQTSGENEDKRIMAGINIVTGGCGTYAVSSKTGVTVHACKTSPSSSSDMKSFVNNNDGVKHQKENNNSHTPRKQQLQSPSSWLSAKPISQPPSRTTATLENIFSHLTRLESYPLEQQQQKHEDRSYYDSTNMGNKSSQLTFRLKFGDHVQVVEMESDGWAKLARENGYILAENGHGSDLVKVGGPKDKACLLEGMMYTVLRRYVSLQKDQDDLIRILEGLRKDLDVTLEECSDTTIVAAENLLLASDATDRSIRSVESSHGDTHLALGKRGDGLSEDEDSFYPSKQAAAYEGQNNAKPKSVTKSFIENLPVIGRFVCGGLGQTNETEAAYGSNDDVQANPLTKERRQKERWIATDSVLQACREDSALLQTATSGIDFRTGMSGHRAVLSSHYQSHEIARNRNPRLMSAHSGIAFTKRGPPLSKAIIEASFSSFPGVTRRPSSGPYSPFAPSGASATEKSGGRLSASDEDSGGRSCYSTPTSSGYCGNNFLARIAVARVPSTRSDKHSQKHP